VLAAKKAYKSPKRRLKHISDFIVEFGFLSHDDLMPKHLKAFKRNQALFRINKNTIHGQLLQNSEGCQDIKIMVAG
jgi:hypothetical protein